MHSVSPRSGIKAITPTHHVVNIADDLNLINLVLNDSFGLDNFVGPLF